MCACVRIICWNSVMACVFVRERHRDTTASVWYHTIWSTDAQCVVWCMCNSKRRTPLLSTPPPCRPDRTLPQGQLIYLPAHVCAGQDTCKLSPTCTYVQMLHVANRPSCPTPTHSPNLTCPAPRVGHQQWPHHLPPPLDTPAPPAGRGAPHQQHQCPVGCEVSE